MEEQKRRVSVIGGGSWATAIVKLLTDNTEKKEIYWWMRNADTVDYIRRYRHNPIYMSSVEIRIPSKRITTDLLQVIKPADVIILCVPAAFLADALRAVTPEML